MADEHITRQFDPRPGDQVVPPGHKPDMMTKLTFECLDLWQKAYKATIPGPKVFSAECDLLIGMDRMNKWTKDTFHVRPIQEILGQPKK
jgi:hypothetical protein